MELDAPEEATQSLAVQPEGGWAAAAVDGLPLVTLGGRRVQREAAFKHHDDVIGVAIAGQHLEHHAAALQVAAANQRVSETRGIGRRGRQGSDSSSHGLPPESSGCEPIVTWLYNNIYRNSTVLIACALNGLYSKIVVRK